MQKDKPRIIQAVQRAIEILECFDSLDMELQLGELSKKVNLNKSTAHGILATLIYHDYVHQNPETGAYKLGPKILEKGLQMLGQMNTYQVVRPHLLNIAKKYRQTTHLFLYVNGVLFCADKVETASFVVLSSRIGHRHPLHASASGKVILANLDRSSLNAVIENIKFTRFTAKTISSPKELLDTLPDIQARGYALEDEEIEEGIYSAAVPIWSYQGLLGTISISGLRNHMLSIKEEVVRDLIESAELASREFGHPMLSQNT